MISAIKDKVSLQKVDPGSVLDGVGDEVREVVSCNGGDDEYIQWMGQCLSLLEPSPPLDVEVEEHEVNEDTKDEKVEKETEEEFSESWKAVEGSEEDICISILEKTRYVIAFTPLHVWIYILRSFTFSYYLSDISLHMITWKSNKLLSRC